MAGAVLGPPLQLGRDGRAARTGSSWPRPSAPPACAARTSRRPRGDDASRRSRPTARSCVDVRVTQRGELLPDDPARRRPRGTWSGCRWVSLMDAGTPQLVKLEDLHVARAAAAGASTSSRSWSRTSPASWRASPACSRGAASTSTRSRSARPTTRAISRITLTLDGAVHPIDQVTKQLHKLVNVLKIRDMEPEETVAREMALFKVSADGREPRPRSCSSPRSSAAKIVDVSQAHADDRGHRRRPTRSRPSSGWSARTA